MMARTDVGQLITDLSRNVYCFFVTIKLHLWIEIARSVTELRKCRDSLIRFTVLSSACDYSRSIFS